MIKPRKNDIWVAPGYQGGQVVYRILDVFSNTPFHKHRNKLYQQGCDLVRYQVRNTQGQVHITSYPLHKFLHKPVGSDGGLRKLAVRPIV